jgi:hypothetical protein
MPCPQSHFWAGENLEYATLFSITGNRIDGIYAIRNPDKLHAVTCPVRVTR